MSGAVQAGLRAAAEILEILRPQSLTSEDYCALEGSRHATKPAQGLSKPRWLLRPRKAYRSVTFIRWTFGFCALAALLYCARRTRFTKFSPRFWELWWLFWPVHRDVYTSQVSWETCQEELRFKLWCRSRCFCWNRLDSVTTSVNCWHDFHNVCTVVCLYMLCSIFHICKVNGLAWTYLICHPCIWFWIDKGILHLRKQFMWSVDKNLWSQSCSVYADSEFD